MRTGLCFMPLGKGSTSVLLEDTRCLASTAGTRSPFSPADGAAALQQPLPALMSPLHPVAPFEASMKGFCLLAEHRSSTLSRHATVHPFSTCARRGISSLAKYTCHSLNPHTMCTAASQSMCPGWRSSLRGGHTTSTTSPPAVLVIPPSNLRSATRGKAGAWLDAGGHTVPTLLAAYLRPCRGHPHAADRAGVEQHQLQVGRGRGTTCDANNDVAHLRTGHLHSSSRWRCSPVPVVLVQSTPTCSMSERRVWLSACWCSLSCGACRHRG